ncbi:MAG TPA: 2-C-methyl-D-erythritol 4-phosphate cytidylyltransferase [Flavobacteriales bacterium]|jgi:2-C-methyl-D-erythritol 4-phosphate cytidylyltransferase|nr:2-C-methyl-D-erythritol 4-phosphate cytidylyltransferase [Flavobacteriales bacterium]QQS71378.1 MAG: 2-C-methyl-D-erythritol 4-phosphate cytidylyltransferase [Flavobacteriales bacterium]HQV38357.1 2-C-methyl-D-erythritol 4-phosphate cytidylyltransferase [Flavobacteriales bacterium]HQW31947.1 2-C-methyl-D-erythritol 4-phosphate cytidylyltransferase [Flavobacteriales bacterium]HQY02486.1 2-C-methyl-D-erythritol 4-phosphate cytidylyltransferase [Flavobacteriales bacterium]
MERSTIIVAGGSGKRMASPVPKQFMLVKGKPVLCHVISAFHLYDPAMQIIVVLPKEQIDSWRVLCIGHGFTIDHTVVAGGEERFHSVREGLKEVAHDGLVAVHDGVRPLVSLGLIERCFAAAELHDAAIPVVPVSSSMRELTDEGSRALDRSRLRIVQTPQCFQVELLRKAFKLPYDPAFTDEATLVERMGNLVRLVEGDERNIKVTTPDDLVIAAALLEEGR